MRFLIWMLPIHLLIQNLLYDISQTTIPFDRMMTVRVVAYRANYDSLSFTINNFCIEEYND